MAGHMGASPATVKHSLVVAVDSEQNLLLVKGGVPGAPNALVTVAATGDNKQLAKVVKYGETMKTEEATA